MKVNLFEVMIYPTMSQSIVTGIQGNQMIRMAGTALSCIGHIGMTKTVKTNMAMSFGSV